LGRGEGDLEKQKEGGEFVRTRYLEGGTSQSFRSEHRKKWIDGKVKVTGEGGQVSHLRKEFFRNKKGCGKVSLGFAKKAAGVSGIWLRRWT